MSVCAIKETMDRCNSLAAKILNQSIALAAVTAGALAVPSMPAAAAAPSCGGFTRVKFLEYVTLFNAIDPRFIEFYHV